MQRWTIIAMAFSLGGLCLLLAIVRWHQLAQYNPEDVEPLQLAAVLPAQARGQEDESPVNSATTLVQETTHSEDSAIEQSKPVITTTTSSSAININTATARQLTDLPGIGEVLAERIIAYREAHGPFSTLEGLLAVNGIGEGKLAKLRSHASVGAQ